MKSYIQGLITGGVFVFAFMVLMGSTDTKSDIGKWQIAYNAKTGTMMVNTTNGDLYRFQYWKWNLISKESDLEK